MSNFEIITKYKDKNIQLPKRSTEKSAGYDFYAAEDCIIPSYFKSIFNIDDFSELTKKTYNLNESAKLIKDLNLKASLVPTGIKVKLNDDEELELRSRSSIASKNLLFLANGVGTIDADYYNNIENEGHIMIAFFNISPFDIEIKKGDKIAQGLIKKYYITDNDKMTEKDRRTGGFGSTRN